MIIKQLVDEDFVNYKKPSMFVAFPSCSWKCERECGMRVCQNSTLATSPNIEIDEDKLVERYLSNPITSAIVIGGLEPFDNARDLVNLVDAIRTKTNDDIVIYTGYTEDEIVEGIKILEGFKNIIVKFGRYAPDQEKHYDKILGVYLASPNQGAKKIS